jgi:hypothetical protein
MKPTTPSPRMHRVMGATLYADWVCCICGAQDGSYLAELLLSKGYTVHGLVRRCSTGGNTTRVAHILHKITLHFGDLTDTGSVCSLLMHVRPNEVRNCCGAFLSSTPCISRAVLLGVGNVRVSIIESSPAIAPGQAH